MNSIYSYRDEALAISIQYQHTIHQLLCCLQFDLMFHLPPAQEMRVLGHSWSSTINDQFEPRGPHPRFGSYSCSQQVHDTYQCNSIFFFNKALFKFVPNRTRWALTLRSPAGAVESTVLVHFSRDAKEPLAQPPSQDGGSLLKM
jgi:hypothetical protein